MVKTKEWRVKAEYDGKVALESEETRVVLSNSLPQDQLAELAKDQQVVGFLEKAAVTELSNGTQETN